MNTQEAGNVLRSPPKQFNIPIVTYVMWNETSFRVLSEVCGRLLKMFDPVQRKCYSILRKFMSTFDLEDNIK